MRFRLAGAAMMLTLFLAADPAVASDPSPAPHPTSTHRAHPAARSAGTGETSTPVPVHSGSRLAGGLPGIDGRVVALGSVLALGVLVGILGMRRD